MTRVSSQVLDEFDRPVQGAQVYVLKSDGTQATLTLDGGGSLLQPVSTDTFGSYYYNTDDIIFRREIWYGGKKRWVEQLTESALDASLRTDLSAVTGAALVGTATGDSAGAVIDALRRGTGPIVVVVAGQSNALGANNGGANPASAKVKTWDPVTGAWGGSDYTAVPWSRTSPDGNGGNNNHGLAAAHFLADTTQRKVYVVLDGVGGTSIDLWVASGTSSARYAALKTKIQNALATTELAGKTTIDLLIWDQGEEDFTRSFATHITSLTTLNTQLRAETWMSAYTPVFAITLSDLHDRYEIQPALRYFCAQVGPAWKLISAKGLPTSDNTHYTGPALFEIGYNRIGPAWLGAHVGELIEPVPFYNRGAGRLIQSDTVAISTYSSMLSWDSRTDGPGVADNFTGNGATTAFTLTSFGTISAVTVNGVAKTNPTDYSVTTASPTGISLPVLTFVTAPANASAIVVAYGSSVNGAANTGGWGFGYRCWPNGNYTAAGGYLCRTTNLCNYTFVYGRENVASDNGDYGFVSGFQNVLANSYGFVCGRGNTLSIDGGFVSGQFALNAGTQAFEVGVGTTAGARKNAFQCDPTGVFDVPQSTGRYRINGVQVVGPRDTGWTADTGTAKKTANATYTAGTTLTYSASYVQAEQTAMATRMAAVEAALQSASQTIKALKDALIAGGGIGT